MCENFVLSVQAPILSLSVRKYRLLLMLNFRVIDSFRLPPSDRLHVYVHMYLWVLDFVLDLIDLQVYGGFRLHCFSTIINLGFDGF